MSQYLFLFTISPVQSFIAQARKTQDLYSGSRLLSHLIEIATNNLPQGSKVVFPSEKTESKPNRFLAVVNTEDAKKIGADLKEIVQKEFIKISNNRFQEEHKGQIPVNFDKQVESFLQIQWVALEHDENQYKKNYEDIERILGGVKNVRQFEQLEEEGKRKCSLCGERNALFYKPLIKEDGKKKKPAYLQNDAIEINSLKVDQGEGLCAVCFTKRFHEKKKFPSTAKLAVMDTLHHLRSKSGELLDGFERIFNRKFNDQLYFEENLNETYFRKHDLEEWVESLADIKDKQKKIKERAKKHDLKFSRYYAAIIFDGDSMGRWLSGGKKLKDTVDLKAFHEALSAKLDYFAAYASKECLVEPKGKTVYTGGDDFLGFVTLKHLFDVIKTLREKFDEQVNQPLKEFKIVGENLTFSAGIAIAHYKTPLSIVLDWARKMEQEAKNIDNNKDAFAIAVLKHSGEIQKTVYKWKYDDCEALAVIGNLAEVLAEDVFSNTFIKNLDSEFRRLMDNEGKFGENHIIEAEIKRLVLRSCMMKREAGESKISELSDSLCNLSGNSKSLENFLCSLHIADFIKRELSA